MLHFAKPARCRKFSTKWIASSTPSVYMSHHDTETKHIARHDRRHVIGDGAVALRAPSATRTSIRDAAWRRRRRFSRVNCTRNRPKRLTEPRRAQARAGFLILVFAMGRLVVVWAQTHPCVQILDGLVSSGQVERGDEPSSPLVYRFFGPGAGSRLILARSAR